MSPAAVMAWTTAVKKSAALSVINFNRRTGDDNVDNTGDVTMKHWEEILYVGKYPYFWGGRLGSLQTQCRTG